MPYFTSQPEPHHPVEEISGLHDLGCILSGSNLQLMLIGDGWNIARTANSPLTPQAPKPDTSSTLLHLEIWSIKVMTLTVTKGQPFQRLLFGNTNHALISRVHRLDHL